MYNTFCMSSVGCKTFSKYTIHHQKTCDDITIRNYMSFCHYLASVNQICIRRQCFTLFFSENTLHNNLTLAVVVFLQPPFKIVPRIQDLLHYSNRFLIDFNVIQNGLKLKMQIYDNKQGFFRPFSTIPKIRPYFDTKNHVEVLSS